MASEAQVEGTESIGVEASRSDIWCSEFESYFIHLLEEEVKKGNRQTTTLTKNAWKFVREEMKKKTGLEYTQNQFKNKFNTLRTKWRNFSSLLKETGVGYNSITGELVVSDDQWIGLCQKYQFANSFRRKGCPHYEKLCTIFGDTTATGANAHPSTRSPSTSETESNNEEEQETSSPRPRKKIKKGKGGRETVVLAMADALAKIGKNSEKKLELMEKKLSTSNATASDIGGTSLVERERQDRLNALQELQNLEDIDSSSFAKAFKKLTEDPNFALLFLQLEEKRRKDVIRNL